MFDSKIYYRMALVRGWHELKYCQTFVVVFKAVSVSKITKSLEVHVP